MAPLELAVAAVRDAPSRGGGGCFPVSRLRSPRFAPGRRGVRGPRIAPSPGAPCTPRYASPASLEFCAPSLHVEAVVGRLGVQATELSWLPKQGRGSLPPSLANAAASENWSRRGRLAARGGVSSVARVSPVSFSSGRGRGRPAAAAEHPWSLLAPCARSRRRALRAATELQGVGATGHRRAHPDVAAVCRAGRRLSAPIPLCSEGPLLLTMFSGSGLPLGGTTQSATDKPWGGSRLPLRDPPGLRALRLQRPPPRE